MDKVEFFNRANASYWNKRQSNYPYQALCPNLVRPEKIGKLFQCLSCVLKDEWRIWGFYTEEDRNKFVQMCAGLGAVSYGSPTNEQ